MFILLFVLLLVILGGCTKECTKNADCKAKVGFAAKCSNGKCIEISNPNICGNSLCETEIENQCSCPQDCGQCSGIEGKLQRSCSQKKECILALNENILKETSFTDTLDIRIASIDLLYSYFQPFDTTKHLFKITFKLNKKQDDVSKLTIKKVKIIEQGKETTKLYGELDINQFFWSPAVKINAEQPLSPQLFNNTGEEKSAQIEIFYEYILKSGSIITDSIKKDMPAKILFVKPTTQPACPNSCDDNNPCTLDTCSSLTNYFCQHEIQSGACCGNNICDSNENECSCPRDCGLCDRKFGNYMAYLCQNNNCVSQLKDFSLVKPKTLVLQTLFTEFSIDNKVSFEEPFNIKVSKFTIESEINNIREGISGIKCTKMQILDNNELLTEKTVSMVFSKNSDKATTVLTASFSPREPEVTKNPQLKLFCEYDKTFSIGNIQHITATNSQYFGNIVFINPS